MAKEKQQRSGILAAGNWVVDQIKVVTHYPDQDGLANILARSVNTGGSPYNILKDLFKLGANFRLSGIGVVGGDINGSYILDDCIKSGIDKRSIHVLKDEITSFTDVITVASTGRRTFLHYKGASSLLSPEHFRLDKYKSRIFHLGYVLLLDSLDSLDAQGLPVSAGILAKARELGYQTSLDLISEPGERYQTVVEPLLPLTDYLFLNTFDTQQLTGIKVKKQGVTRVEALTEAAKIIFEKGVGEWVIFDFSSGIVAVNASGDVYQQGKALVPKELVAGQAGTADAVAASVLMALHEGWDMQDGLMLAACASGSCLTHVSCSDGILPIEQSLKQGKKWGFQSL